MKTQQDDVEDLTEGLHETSMGQLWLKNPSSAIRSLSSAEIATLGGREQEDLVGHPLDGAPGGEDQAGGEVDETLGVVVVHLAEVHDHGRAVAVVLTDESRLVVVAGVQGGDAAQLGHDSRLDRGRTTALGKVGHRGRATLALRPDAGRQPPGSRSRRRRRSRRSGRCPRAGRGTRRSCASRRS